jgi:anti-sigma B factor antagonist
MASIEKTVPESGQWIERGPLSIRTDRDPLELYVVEFYGELDLSGAELADQVLQAVAETDAQQIIVDLSGLDFIDSSGLRVLLRAYARDHRDGNRVVFLRGPEPVQRVVEITGLDGCLPFAD